MSNRVSVIIPTKNRKNDLLEVVDSVANQGRIPEELIIVDQSDHLEARTTIEKRWQHVENSKLIYIHDRNIKGLVDAKRVGTHTSSCDVVCFLDDDVILDTNFLREILKPFEMDATVKGCSGIFTNFPERNKLYSVMYKLFHKGIFSDPRTSVFVKYEGYGHQLVASSVLWGGMTAWRPEVLERVPFDTEKNFFMMEDIDYSTRVIEVFGNCLFINPNARVFHKYSQLNRGSESEQEKKKIYEYITYYKKRKHSRFALLHLIWLFIGLFLHVVYQIVKTGKFELLTSFVRGIGLSR